MSNKEFKAIIGVGVIAALVLAFTTFYTYALLFEVNNLKNKYGVKFDVYIEIIDPLCEGCENITPIIEALKDSPKLNIKGISYISAENTSNVTYAPAIIIKVENSTPLYIKNFIYDGKRFIYETQHLPRYNIRDREIEGDVEIITFKSPECEECFDINTLISILNQSGVYIKSIKEGSPEKYGVKLVPTIAISEDIKFYPIVTTLIPYLEDSKQERFYIFKPFPPYKDLESGKIRGKAQIIYVNATQCENCFDPKIYRFIAERVGIYVANESYLNFEDLDSKYKSIIRVLPTAIITGDLEVYKENLKVLKDIGMLKENYFIFTNPEKLNIPEDKYIQVK